MVWARIHSPVEYKQNISLTTLGIALTVTCIFSERADLLDRSQAQSGRETCWSLVGIGVNSFLWEDFDWGKQMQDCLRIKKQKRNEGRQTRGIVVWEDGREWPDRLRGLVILCVCVCSHDTYSDWVLNHTHKLSTSTVHKTLNFSQINFRDFPR